MSPPYVLSEFINRLERAEAAVMRAVVVPRCSHAVFPLQMFCTGHFSRERLRTKIAFECLHSHGVFRSDMPTAALLGPERLLA